MIAAFLAVSTRCSGVMLLARGTALLAEHFRRRVLAVVWRGVVNLARRDTRDHDCASVDVSGALFRL